jgi:hypothetical protein
MIGMMSGSRVVVGRVGWMSGAWDGRGSMTPFWSASPFPEKAYTYHWPHSDLRGLIFTLQPTLKLLLLLLSDSISILGSGYSSVSLPAYPMDNLRAWVESPAGLDTFSLCDDPSSNARLNIELAMKGSSGGFEAGTALAYSISPVPIFRTLTYLSLDIDIDLSDMRCRWALLCVRIHSERCNNVYDGRSITYFFRFIIQDLRPHIHAVFGSTFGT